MRTPGALAEPVPAPLPTATANRTATPGSPLAPASTAVRVFTAVVLGVEVGTELETVVTPTHQPSLAT